MDKMKKIAILGSTGSIGTQTLEAARENKDLEIVGLAAGNNIKLLEAQIREFRPKKAAVWSEEKAAELRLLVADLDVQILWGMDGLIEIAEMEESRMLVTAIVGMIGIRPTIAAIRAGKDIALAKECNVKILPVDSEHSAIFQCMNGENHGQLQKILLTASGGPFRGKKRHELENIQVVVQPQRIIHSAVEFVDGAVIAQLGTPDMKLPIQYAIYYPDRRFLPGERLDFWKLKQITFDEPDLETFTGLALAFEAAKQGGNIPTVYNAANEKAVAKFLNREIGYLDITRIIGECMESIKKIDAPSVEEILDTEANVYELIESRW